MSARSRSKRTAHASASAAPPSRPTSRLRRLRRRVRASRGLSRPATIGWATRFSHLADPGAFALFAAALVLVALARRRLRTAVVVAIILAGANVSTQPVSPGANPGANGTINMADDDQTVLKVTGFHPQPVDPAKPDGDWVVGSTWERKASNTTPQERLLKAFTGASTIVCTQDAFDCPSRQRSPVARQSLSYLSPSPREERWTQTISGSCRTFGRILFVGENI